MTIKTEKSFLNVIPMANTDLLAICVDEVREKLLKKPEIVVYGRVVNQKRNVGFFSDTSKGYYYSGKLARSQPLTENLQTLLEMVNGIYGAEFNGILINEYENGSDYISPHSDDERNLDKIGVVAVSFGAVRIFRIRDKFTKAIVEDIKMLSGQLLHMGGDFQKEFTHEIPVEKKVKEPRYSFTFRRHLD
jgi:alkylated DNA repair dioxygenase AlkB